jgi:hypothetical protein
MMVQIGDNLVSKIALTGSKDSERGSAIIRVI